MGGRRRGRGGEEGGGGEGRGRVGIRTNQGVLLHGERFTLLQHRG